MEFWSWLVFWTLRHLQVETPEDVSVLQFTSQGVEGVVQLVGVAVDALQSAFGVGFGDINSVQEGVESLQRGNDDSASDQ